MANSQTRLSLFTATITHRASILALTGALLSACSAQYKSEGPPPPADIPGSAKGNIDNRPDGKPAPVPETLEATWVTKDPGVDGLEGVSADRAYTELGLKTGVEPILVAVIDSGVDVNHEDLKAQIWNNPGETGVDEKGNDKATNKIDDDKNGYVDDVHGWNFLGSYDKDGKPVHVEATTFEVTRELVRLKKLKSERDLTAEEQALFEKVDQEVTTARTDAKTNLDRFQAVKAEMMVQYEVLKDLLAVPFEAVTLDLVQKLTPSEEAQKVAQAKLVDVFTNNSVKTTARVIRSIERANDQLDHYYNEAFDPRKDIIGDDPTNVEQRGYGNNDVQGPDASHGTHVAGIIGAVRGNNIGIDGIATDVRIMAIRAVPNGDEYDKDVANAVRYATDNGARVINMSFGKGYSPLKTKVDEAFLYAASKGVLIIHSAGNDGKLNTATNNFPNKHVLAAVAGEIGNWIEVAASSKIRGLNLPAFFSNYGKESVDIFAPGFEVISSIPGNQYASFSGTSMAGPCVAGVGALILSQHPDLNGAQVRDSIRTHARLYTGLEVYSPNVEGEKNVVQFDALTITGGVSDVLTSLKNAAGI
jgi:cell wall-associated protease